MIRAAGRDAQVVALYLVTCPSSTMIGLYYLPLPTLSHETGIPLQGASKALRSLSEADFSHYDETTETIWVPEMARFQIGEELKAGDKRILGVVRELLVVKSSRYAADFYAKYKERFRLPVVDLTKPLPSPSEAPSKPLRSQEQEQEQEQNTTFVASKPTGVESNGFPAWYDCYPRHVARRAAEIAYRAALKRGTAAEIMAGLERQRASFLAKAKDKVPHPATWLNGDRWKDEAEEPPNPYLDWPEMADCRICGSCHDPKAWPKDCAR